MRSPSAETRAAADSELGCGIGAEAQARIERSQTAARSLPSLLTLRYYDPDRDYQMAQARAATGGVVANAESIDLPVVLNASGARALAESSLARRWAERDSLTLRLPPSYLTLEPGMLVTPPGDAADWSVDAVTVDSMAAVVQLRPRYSVIAPLTADPGRALASVDVPVQPTSLAVIELGTSDDLSADRPVVVVAASSPAPTWRAVPLTIDCGGTVTQSQTASLATVFGTAQTTLPDGQSALFDTNATVDVQLEDPEQWLESRDDDALVNGENAAIVGSELIQFGNVLALGNGAFRLSRLLRGRRGTEWAMPGHAAGETFVLLDPQRLRNVAVTSMQVGVTITVTPGGLADSGANAETLVVSGEALRPPSPVHLQARLSATGDLVCTWCRRSRLGWAWIDGVDAPLGCSTEQYRIQIAGPSGSLQLEASSPSATISQMELQGVGGGEITVTVTQVGDLAESRPASLHLSF